MNSIVNYSGLSSVVRSMRMNSKSVAAAGVIALGLTGAAYAGGPGGSYIQGGYADWDDFDNGFNVGGSLMITPGARLFADYTDTDLEQLRAGAGVVIPMTNVLGFEVGGSYQRLEADFPGGGDDDGFGAHGIARFSATPELTLSGKLEYVFRDDLEDEAVLGADLDYRFTPQLSAFASYEIFDELDNDLIMVGGRLNF